MHLELMLDGLIRLGHLEEYPMTRPLLWRLRTEL